MMRPALGLDQRRASDLQLVVRHQFIVGHLNRPGYNCR